MQIISAPQDFDDPGTRSLKHFLSPPDEMDHFLYPTTRVRGHRDLEDLCALDLRFVIPADEITNIHLWLCWATVKAHALGYKHSEIVTLYKDVGEWELYKAGVSTAFQFFNQKTLIPPFEMFNFEMSTMTNREEEVLRDLMSEYFYAEAQRFLYMNEWMSALCEPFAYEHKKLFTIDPGQYKELWREWYLLNFCPTYQRSLTAISSDQVSYPITGEMYDRMFNEMYDNYMTYNRLAMLHKEIVWAHCAQNCATKEDMYWYDRSQLLSLVYLAPDKVLTADEYREEMLRQKAAIPHSHHYVQSRVDHDTYVCQVCDHSFTVEHKRRGYDGYDGYA